jgi:LysR family nod box-dependent transcriptional activator
MMERGGIERRVEVTVNTFSAIPQCVVGTQRIATIHRRLAEQRAQFLPIRILETPMEIPSFKWGLQWHEMHNVDPVNQWFLWPVYAVISTAMLPAAVAVLFSVQKI